MFGTRFSFWGLLLCPIAPLLCFETAAAQVADQVKERLLEEQKRNARQTRAEEAQPDTKISTPEEVEAADAGPCFHVSNITIDGVTKLDPSWLEKIIGPYTNSCMGQVAVDTLMQLITQAYLDKGLITSRAYLPEQDLASGVLQIIVVEGLVEKFEYQEASDGQTGKGKAKKVLSAFPTRPGKILNLRDIEQGVDNMNKVPSANVKLDIAPGQSVGGSVLKLTNQVVDPTRGSIRYYHSGDKIGSTKSADILFEQDNLLGLNDTLFLGYSGGSDSNSLSGYFNVPYGYWNYSVSANYSESSSLLTATTELFEQTFATNASARKLVYRDGNSKNYLEGKIDFSNNYRFINSTELTPQELLSIRLGGSREYYTDSYFLSAGGGVTSGWLISDLVGTNSGDGPDSNFFLLDFNGQARFSPIESLSVYSSLYGKWSFEPLYSKDQISIGGRTGLRGVSVISISGDRGVTLTNEFTFPKLIFDKCCGATSAPGVELEKVLKATQPFAFVDMGIVDTIAGDTTSYGAGAGIGLRLQHKRLNFETTVSHSIDTSGDLQSAGLTVSIKLTAKVF